MSERSASTYRNGQFTSSHVQALNILGLNHVHYLAEEVIRVYGVFDSKGRPVSYKVDILIDDPDYSSGVVEIDGGIHTKLKHELNDERRDQRLRSLSLWVEHITNENVSSIMTVLEKHRRPRDDYS